MNFLDDDDDMPVLVKTNLRLSNQSKLFLSTKPTDISAQTPSEVRSATHRHLSSTPEATFLAETDPRTGSSRKNTMNNPTFAEKWWQWLWFVPLEDIVQTSVTSSHSATFPIACFGSSSAATCTINLRFETCADDGVSTGANLLPSPLRSMPDTQLLHRDISSPSLKRPINNTCGPSLELELTFSCVTAPSSGTPTQVTGQVKIISEANVSCIRMILERRNSHFEVFCPSTEVCQLHCDALDVIHIGFTAEEETCTYAFQLVPASESLITIAHKSASKLMSLLRPKKETRILNVKDSDASVSATLINKVPFEGMLRRSGGKVSVCKLRANHGHSYPCPHQVSAILWGERLLRRSREEQRVPSEGNLESGLRLNLTVNDVDNAKKNDSISLTDGRSSTISLKTHMTSRVQLDPALVESTRRRSPTPVLDAESRLAAFQRTSSVLRSVPLAAIERENITANVVVVSVPAAVPASVPSSGGQTFSVSTEFPTPLMRKLTGTNRQVGFEDDAIKTSVTNLQEAPTLDKDTVLEEHFTLTALPRRSQPIDFAKLPETIRLNPSTEEGADLHDKVVASDDEDTPANVLAPTKPKDKNSKVPTVADTPPLINQPVLQQSTGVNVSTANVNTNAQTGTTTTTAHSVSRLVESYVSATIPSENATTIKKKPLTGASSGVLLPAAENDTAQLGGESFFIIANSCSTSPQRSSKEASGSGDQGCNKIHNLTAPMQPSDTLPQVQQPLRSNRSLLPQPGTVTEQRGEEAIIINVLTDTQGSAASNGYAKSTRRVLFSSSSDKAGNDTSSSEPEGANTGSSHIMVADLPNMSAKQQTEVSSTHQPIGTKRTREEEDSIGTVFQQNDTMIVNGASSSTLTGYPTGGHYEMPIAGSLRRIEPKDPFATPSPSQIRSVSPANNNASPSRTRHAVGPETAPNSSVGSSTGKESQFYRHLDSQIARALDRLQEDVQNQQHQLQPVPPPASEHKDTFPPPPHRFSTGAPSTTPSNNLLFGTNLFAPLAVPPNDTSSSPMNEHSPQRPSPSLNNNWESQQVFYNYK